MIERSTVSVVVDGIPCMFMRGGTSKGAYFIAEDLPADPAARNDLLLRIMGSPDRTQIDGLGGAQRSTSKVAIVSRSSDPEVDIDYLFLQVQPAEATVTDQQTCGNILAGVAPFAIERGLHPVSGETTRVRIRVLNDGGRIVTTVQTPHGKVSYAGNTLLSGVPFPSAAIPLEFAADNRHVLPSGNPRDVCDGVEVTCLNVSKPYVLIRASDLGISGYESPPELEANQQLRKRLESIRIAAGQVMGLGDVNLRETPKLTIVAPPRCGGAASTRTFTPHTCHPSIGVQGAIAVAAGLRIPGSIAQAPFVLPQGALIRIEHATGYFDVDVALRLDVIPMLVERIAAVRTARKIFDGRVWPRQND
jgi:4-oxalomesaconate tautomerase